MTPGRGSTAAGQGGAGGRGRPATPEERFAALVEELGRLPGVTPPGGGRGFGAGALRYRTKIFAVLVRGRLVVRLPRARVDSLVVAGEGDRFDASKGTPMKEGLSVAPASNLAWAQLARDGLAFVSGG